MSERIYDDELLSALRDGGRTNHVADRLGRLRERPKVLRALKRLERLGAVERHPQYSYPNDIYWRPHPSPLGPEAGGEV